jgi:hypothetical protein
MSYELQNVVALSAVACAAGYLMWTAIGPLLGRKSQNCGGCRSCPANQNPADQRQVVALNMTESKS